MKLLLTGASGLVGGNVARLAAAQGHEVTGIVGRFAGAIPGLAQQQRVDLTDEHAIIAVLRSSVPDAIINCAAISEPGQCDADPVRSAAMNVALPRLLARVACDHDARLLHLSSEQVFDGGRTAPYTTGDTPRPINLYGRQKLASESAVLATAPEHAAVIRAPLLLGNSPSRQRSLHERLLADWAAGRTPRLYTDEFRQPCTAANLAEVLLELLDHRELCGVFHWAGAELVSRYELGARMRTHFQLSETAAPLVAVSRADTPAVAAQRPPCLALDLSPLAGLLRTRPQTLAEQLPSLLM